MIEPNTTTGADELDRDKLAKVLGMLASPHDGESLAAGRAADALVRAVGATSETVLSDSGIAEEACRVLLTENVELRFENEELYRRIETLLREKDRPPMGRVAQSVMTIAITGLAGVVALVVASGVFLALARRAAKVGIAHC